MLDNFFRINLPYGIAKNSNGEWMAFNREYLPLGFNRYENKGNPGQSYLDFPIYTKYKGLSEKTLIDLAHSEDSIHRNEKNEIEKVFFYKDSSNPTNQKKDNQHLWDDYFSRLTKLSKLQRY